jgi:hypothetical protein
MAKWFKIGMFIVLCIAGTAIGRSMADPKYVPPTGSGIDYQCTSTWNCVGNVNGCSFNAGIVPSCEVGTPSCNYNIPNYPCSGTDPSGSGCMVPFNGCK